ncbi:MAG: carbohydrate ABC transporter permease [Spirochaetia bacterium]|jgi:multiple sugar transport system permease protein|nr:carbohydrate ABC transporter permease [Spirochaetia bacterium]MCE1208860.1 carbohydrate ABC transporter permease [Spirochaetia bacterium]NLX44522.1 carbohydrate ABC transporter permease [Treponema sp.]
MKRKHFSAGTLALHILLLTGSVVMVLPFVWMLSTSFKPPSEVLSWPPQFIPKTWTIANYVAVFKTAPFLRFFANSLLVSIVSTASILISSTLAGYVFGKFDFPFKNLLFIVILATAMVPFETYMIPLYLRMVQFGWVNKFAGLVAPYLVMSYGIFFMRQNVHTTIPDELIDAARIDGLSEFGIYRKIVLPLLSGSCNALAIFAFMQSWAAFIWPLIITSSRELWTMELGLGMFQYRFSIDLGPINAGSVLSIFPVLVVFLLLRKNIVKGITLTGMKA